VATIKIKCVSCNAQYTIDSSILGKKLRCKHCNEVFRAAATAEYVTQQVPPPLSLTNQVQESANDMDSSLGALLSATDPLCNFAADSEPSSRRLKKHFGQPFGATLTKAVRDPWQWGLVLGTILSLFVLPLFGTSGLVILLLIIFGSGLLAWGIWRPPQQGKMEVGKNFTGSLRTIAIAIFVIVIAAQTVFRELSNDRKASDVSESMKLIHWIVGSVFFGVFLVLLWRLRKKGLHRVASLTYLAALFVAFVTSESVSTGLNIGRRVSENHDSDSVLLKNFKLLPVETTLPAQLSSPDFRPYEAGVEKAEVHLGIQAPTPGFEDHIAIYRPSGYGGKALPLVLMPPSGVAYFLGARHSSETDTVIRPYIMAGFMVVTFDLDGYVPDLEKVVTGEKKIDDKTKSETYVVVGRSKVGAVNARNALEYTLQKVPGVDPARIYTAGHLSGANIALLLPAIDSRIAGAYSAGAIVNGFAVFQKSPLPRPHPDVLSVLQRCFVETAPGQQAGNIKCPTLAAFYDDDSFNHE
jgi:predicted Zn finger-like uncharacterized protein